MRVSAMIASLALLLAVLLGFSGQRYATAASANETIRPVSTSWYRSLPRDPAIATSAYLARVPPAMRRKGDAIGRSRYWALAARVLANVGTILLFLYSEGAHALDLQLGHCAQSRWRRDFSFSAALLMFQFVVTLPVEVCASYIRYRIFGFSGQPFLGWLWDDVIGWATTAIFYAVGLTVLASMVRRRPRTWPPCAGAIYLTLALLYTVASPIVIEPLTNNYTPLPDTRFTRDILDMAKTAGVPAHNIYTDDASRQSRRVDAHVSGVFGVARITVDDNALISSRPVVRALLAHEMGHFVKHHALKMVLFASVVAVLGFTMIAWLQPPILRSMGTRWRISDAHQTAAIAIFWLLFTIWSFVSDPITNAYARFQERQADEYSLDLAKEPAGLADLMIQDADIGPLRPTMIDLILFYDHPSDAARVQAAMQWRAKHGPIL